VQIMRMVEARMLQKEERTAVYRQYQREVPLCVPWWLLGRKQRVL